MPETHRISSIKVVKNWPEFSEFITDINICLNETIDEENGSRYFFNDLKTQYATLFSALNRIRIYRNNENHLRLKEKLDKVLQDYMESDLLGVKLNSYAEPWFLMQQICLDELFVAIQVEINKYS